MKVSIEIAGESYIPLAAVPFVTGQFFTLSDVAHIISNPESYCDANNSTTLSALQVTGDGRLVLIHYSSLQALAESGLSGTSSVALAATVGIVVSERSLHTLYRTLVHELSDARTLDSTKHFPHWDLEAVLPAPIKEMISESIRKPLRKTTLRANSKLAMLTRFGDAVDQIERKAKTAGIPFDRRNLPGRKRDFLELVGHVDRTATLAVENFNRHYAAELGLRWRQGSRANDAKPLLALFGMTVGPTG